MYRVHMKSSTRFYTSLNASPVSKKISSSFEGERNGFQALRIGEEEEEEEETPLIRPISKNIPIVHDETRFRSLTFFFFLFFSSILLCFLVFFQKFFINFDRLERAGFLEFYKFLYICINRTKDLEIRNSSSRLSCFFSKNYFLILIVSKDRQRKI